MKYLSKNIYKGVNYGRISIMEIIEIPRQCSTLVINFNNTWRIFTSSHQAERFCRNRRLEIVSKEVVGTSWVITVKRADSFI